MCPAHPGDLDGSASGSQENIPEPEIRYLKIAGLRSQRSGSDVLSRMWKRWR
jgi:hypothetical protein